MSNQFWFAVNCRRSGEGDDGPWTAHWIEASCKNRAKKEISDLEGGFLVFRTDDYSAFQSAVLAQISRLAGGEDGSRYSGKNAKVAIAYDCNLCAQRDQVVPMAIQVMIDRYNKEHGGQREGEPAVC